MAAHENVHITIEDRIAVLTIDHPPVNALDRATFDDLERAFDKMMIDDAIKVIVVTGSGRSFIAGADVNALAAMSTVEDAEQLAKKGQSLFLRIERSSKPIIAAINGRYCLGGGNELAMACHIRIAEEKVKFGQPEIKLGLIPGWGGSRRLVHLVGLGKALELILTGDHVRAAEAHQLGLVNRVVPEGEALNEALRLAKQLAALSSQALCRALDVVYACLDLDVEQGLAYEAGRFGEMATTEDMREGLSAFLEKRRPEFRDR
ncbi:MAG: enoyl-CoA hydratase/isomerase family protein [Anaerolineae bacterium]|nr:enoyl-CoA hydratase/isomerase family protein [Anaerolineae bacterium]